LQALEALHANKERECQKLLASVRGEKPKRTAAERAADLLKGGCVDPTPTPTPDVLVALDKELSILRQAICERTRQLDAIAAEISHAECLRLKPAFNAAMVRALEHLEQAVAAFPEGEGVADRLRKAGYRVSSVTMPDLAPPGIAALGMTELQRFRRALAALGAPVMSSTLFLEFDFAAKRDEMESVLQSIVAELPALRAAAEAAKEAAELAQHRFENFLKRTALATRHGQAVASPALLDMLEDERQVMRTANAAATQARLAVENAEWAAACRREDLAQIDLPQNPPPSEHKPEVIKRQPPQIDIGDAIVFPTGRST
jgi:hypothetical protein